ncbi:crossover junction endodeoxyribonuclease RuvC [Polycyclovorans algicola]|uniref:crossover junction endodeoxyribonuclease RuvC n=1 Tax=Polycyclovorans algicola TaxID=616992 RepID=UPI0005BA531B|nr:crossover junction endodeoxyribonuclease RuvC [Polycyclovorans algicola]
MTRILGIDPGSRHTGFGVIDVVGRAEHYVACGRINSVDGSMAERLNLIFRRLCEVIDEHRPDEAALEETFVNRVNAASALVLGQARGVAFCALGLRGLTVAEYSASQVKQAVTGSGRADKTQIQQMVRMLLKLDVAPVSDAADALGVALTHARVRATRLATGQTFVGSWK